MDAMPRRRDRNLVREKDRHGNSRWYLRVGHGPRIRIRGEFGTAAFNEAVAAAQEGRRPAAASRRGGQAGSVQWLVDQYMASARWARLKPATRKQREGFLRAMTARVGAAPFATIDAASIRASFDSRAATPFAARNWLKTMRALFGWALEAQHAAVNPAAGIRAPAPRTAGFLPWTDQDRAAFESAWPPGTTERLIYEIAANTGLRRGDIAALGRPHLRNGWLAIRTEKTGQLVEIPVLQPLARAIAAGPCGDLSFVATRLKRPYTKESMAAVFAEACKAAGLVRKSLHGIRKSAAAMAAENDFTEAQLNSWFGWADGSTESAVYTRSARRRSLAQAGGMKMSKVQK
jgi:integrase